MSVLARGTHLGKLVLSRKGSKQLDFASEVCRCDCGGRLGFKRFVSLVYLGDERRQLQGVSMCEAIKWVNRSFVSVQRIQTGVAEVEDILRLTLTRLRSWSAM